MFSHQPSQTPIFETRPFKRSNIFNTFFKSILRLLINLLDPLHRCHFRHFTFTGIHFLHFIIFRLLIFGLHFHGFNRAFRSFRHQHEAVVQHPRLLQGRLRLISGGVATGLRLLLGFGALRMGLLHPAKILEAPLLLLFLLQPMGVFGLHLRLFASDGPGLGARALHGRHGALVDPAELRKAGDQATPGVFQGPGARIVM
mmetsp:Transcript_83600/g.132426  ORF Transcript_83600/g.132426 Transcript_83600/m.132426 type:complete len:200 (+) Transcript_83600:581-1180(+)